MSDRAKARLLAAGLSVLLSAQVVLILLGALVFFNRTYLGGANPGFSSILGNPPVVILPGFGPGGGGGGAGGAGGGGGQPGGTPGPGATPPPGVPGQPQPLIGVTAQADVPVVGQVTLPLRFGTSSGNNFSATVPLPRAKLAVTISRRPICDLTKCTGGSARASHRSFKAHHRPTLKWHKWPHVPPGHSLAHALNRARHSLLR